jgi:hypothetical protein
LEHVQLFSEFQVPGSLQLAAVAQLASAFQTNGGALVAVVVRFLLKHFQFRQAVLFQSQ